MSRFVLASVLAPLLLAGCAGSVTTEEVDGFGPVVAATWVYLDDSDYHYVVLSNVPGYCGKLQAFYEAQEDWLDAVNDLTINDLDEYCEVLEEPSLDLARAGNALIFEGAHYLSFSVREDGDSEPEEEEYEVGGDPAVDGSLRYHENSPYQAVLEDYDPDDDDINCGVDEDDLVTRTDDWYLEDGDLEITAVNDEATVAGRFEGELAEPGGKGEGDISFSFSATFCEID